MTRKPELVRDGDDVGWVFHEYGVTVRLEEIRIEDGQVQAMMAIDMKMDDAGAIGNLWWGKVNLAWGDGRARIVKDLTVNHADLPWSEILRMVAIKTTELIKEGEPVVDLSTMEVDDDFHYLVERLLPEGETTVLFAEGGTGKSTLASAIALAIRTGRSLPGGLRPTRQGPVLYLDWETHAAESARRLKWVARGWGIAPAPLLYRRQTTPLADDIKSIRRLVEKHRPELVIVDSIALACGGEPEKAEVILRMYGALRTLSPATRLLITHVPKNGHDDPSKARTAFGSVFIREMARSVWEMRKDAESTDDRVVTGLYHRKTNYGALQKPIGLTIIYDKEAKTIRIDGSNIADNVELAAGAGLAFRIRDVLKRGSLSAADISSELSEREDSVSRTLRRMGDVVRLDGKAAGGRGHQTQWGLAANGTAHLL